MQFSDKCIIDLQAGNGGDGVVSWRREAHYAEGGPWGGDGGKGGNIIILGDHNLNSLHSLKYIKRVNAESGENGQTKLCHGKNGEDYVLKVPIGTSIINLDNNKEIVDILKPGQKYIICYGGKGGRGNAHFKSSFNKAPTLFERGEKGRRLKILLDLKYIADVGLIGLPNAGKSTFINSVSNANSKVANYKFTTLTPILGVVTHQDKKLVFADIPGLIEGASTGIGLGHEFLKHIERCHFLIHIVSMDPEDNLDPIESYKVINNELLKYKKELIEKPIFLVANKIDLEESKIALKKFVKHFKNIKVYDISAINNVNTKDLLDDIFNKFDEYKNIWEKNIEDKINSFSVVRLEKEPESDLTIERIDDNLWKVHSSLIQYWFDRIPQTTSDNVVRFNQKIKLDEIEKKMKKNGAKVHDTFLICDMEYIIE
ncbi:MAG: GTPase ObgE [Malacoplasma sp.]